LKCPNVIGMSQFHWYTIGISLECPNVIGMSQFQGGSGAGAFQAGSRIVISLSLYIYTERERTHIYTERERDREIPFLLRYAQ
jgi:hypothetical protein